jgi:membrane protease YdiL (CAAX protease family)
VNPGWRELAGRAVRPSLVDRVERDHHQTHRQIVRRRVVVAFTLLIGSVLLGVSLSIRPGDDVFYVMTVLVALTWVAGALLSGPLYLGRIRVRERLRRPILTPMVTGLVLAAVFVTGALVVREVPPLRDAVNSVLAHARYGAIVPILAVTVLNGVAEEVFFRGGLFAAIGHRHAVPVTTVVYAAVTLATGNLMLVFAAFLLGLVLGLQRRASGGILAPILTHITWSTTMVLTLPVLIGS